jgi:predicted DNA-binding protein
VSKVPQTFKLSAEVAERLAVHSRITGRTKTQIVERAILRYCGNGKDKP